MELDWDSLSEGADTMDAPIPEGTDYTVKVKDAEWTKSKKGAPMLRLVLGLEGGPHSGKEIWDFYVLNNEFGKRNFVRMTQTLLGKGHRVDFNVSPEEIARPYIGQRMLIDVKHGDPYQGRVSYNVRNIRPVNDGGTTAAAPAPAPAPAPAAAPVADDTPPPQV